jgi:hypothetical protein
MTLKVGYEPLVSKRHAVLGGLSDCFRLAFLGAMC